MIILEGIDGLRRLPQGAVLSIGNFDGLHRGHAEILRRGAALRDTSGSTGLAVVTFEPHPMTVLRPESVPPRLTPPAMKRELIERSGADFYVLLPPSHEVLDLSAEDFFAILRDEVKPRHLVEGQSFYFGKGRAGTIEKLRQWCTSSEIELHIVDPVRVALLNLAVAPVSSSIIRWLLQNGRVRDAAICLGRPYALEGEVIKGHQRGRTIGVPTANLKIDLQPVPLDGVYAGRCTVNGKTYPTAISIGTMPTFGENQRQIEAHLIGFDGDLYGQDVRVEFIDWIREQWKMDGMEALKAQMARDMDVVRSHFKGAPERAIASADV